MEINKIFKLKTSQKTNLSQPRILTSKLPHFLCKCFLVFCANSSRKMCLKNSTKSTLKFCVNQQQILPHFCAFNHRNLYYTDCNKCSRTTSKFVPQKLCLLPRELCQTVPLFLCLINHLEVCSQTVLYRTVQFLLEICAIIICRLYYLNLCANNLMQVVLPSGFALFN